MSLFDFGITGTPREARKITSSITSVPAKKRDFQQSWMKKFSWLNYDSDNQVMFCRFCRSSSSSESFFVTGSCNFRIDPLKAHEKSVAHVHAVASEAAKQHPSETPLAKTMPIECSKKMKVLFNTAYYIALNEMPFTVFPAMCALQRKWIRRNWRYIHE